MVFEVKYLKYTLFVPILPGSMKASLDHVGTIMWGQSPSAVRQEQLDTSAGAVNLGNAAPCLLIPHSSRIMSLYVVRIGREQFLPQQPVTSRSTSESIQRKLIKQRNT